MTNVLTTSSKLWKEDRYHKTTSWKWPNYTDKQMEEMKKKSSPKIM